MLKTETNTPKMQRRITDAFAVSDHAARYETPIDWSVVFDRGQWWITANDGAQWSVCDASGPGTIDCFTFEQVSEGA